MTLLLLRYWWLVLLISTTLPTCLLAQQPAIDAYWVKVVTIDGNHFSGLLDDIDESYLYLSQERNPWQTDDGRIPVNQIRKVAVRRKNQTTAVITGAVVGGLLVGYLVNRSLMMRQARSPVTHALTLTFAIAGGAAGGLVVGSAVGRATRRMIRPLRQTNPTTFLVRQLKPFSLRYQQDFINRLPKSSQ